MVDGLLLSVEAALVPDEESPAEVLVELPDVPEAVGLEAPGEVSVRLSVR